MMSLLRELWRRSPLLTAVGLVHVVLLMVAVTAGVVDDRTVLGINNWTKPAKFMASISIYLFTVAWLIGELERPRIALKVIAWGIALSMIVETICLFTQGIRGTTTHYNQATPLDGMIFGSMGLAIAVDSILMMALLILFFRKNDLASVYVWGIRIGIAVFLLGGWVGGQMITAGAHTVGAPDGGAGLPVLNWSTVAGDLRIAHALGLHGLQVFPFLGLWLASRSLPEIRRRGALAFLVGFAVVYVMVFAGVLSQARSGQPLIGL